MNIKSVKRFTAFLLCAVLLCFTAACSQNGDAPAGVSASESGATTGGGSVSGGGTTSEEYSNTVTVTIIEGQSLTQIFNTLEEEGVCSASALMECALNGDYSGYPLLSQRPQDENRCFELEGYLYPDTYEFYRDAEPAGVIEKFLNNTENRIDAELRNRAAEIGRTVDEILTVASIIEKEGSEPTQAAKIAGVIYNRLDIGQQLQMDTSIMYIENYVKPYITGDINRYNSYYNTYKCAGLPEGPICNPGMVAIKAALYPEEVSYYYFCHDSEGNYYYADTFAEHSEIWESIS